MSEIYVISDPHFYHDNVIKFANRPFVNMDNMIESMVAQWNNIVSKRDVVICTGDWGWGTKSYHLASELNGMIRLVMGNHDYGDLSQLIKHFHSVHGSLKKGDILFSHIPVFLDNWHTWKYVVHGHYHSKAENVPDWRYFNANMDALGRYSPIHIEEIHAEFRKRKLEELVNGDGRDP